MPTRSQSASTSLRIWEDRNTVCPRSLRLLYALAKDHLHQRIEAGSRLVEQQQVGSGRKCGDQLHLLPVSLGERADLLVRLEIEALDELISVDPVDPPVHLTQELEGLRTCERRPEERLASYVCDPPMCCNGIPPRVDPEQLAAAACRAVESQQEPNRGRLSCPVRSQVPVHLPLADVQIQCVEGDRAAITLRQRICSNGRRPGGGSIAHRFVFSRVDRCFFEVALEDCWS